VISFCPERQESRSVPDYRLLFPYTLRGEEKKRQRDELATIRAEPFTLERPKGSLSRLRNGSMAVLW